MATVHITNTSTKGAIGLPGGPLIAAGATEAVEKTVWDAAKKRKSIGHYVESGVLTEGDAPKAADEPGTKRNRN